MFIPYVKTNLATICYSGNATAATAFELPSPYGVVTNLLLPFGAAQGEKQREGLR